MKSVEIKVDMHRREKLRRLHTATHIVNFCARNVLGNHVWQNGSNLKPEFGTLDITHYENLTLEEIAKIENMANEVIFENKEVEIEEIDRTQAERKYGYTIYQGGAIPMKKIRIISVMDNDIEACGGIHMQSTAGIGLIKIVDSQKIQDGVVRLKYVVREFALDYTHENEKILEEIAEVYSVRKDSLTNTSKKFFEEWKEQRKEIDKLKEKLKGSYLQGMESSPEKEFTFDEDFDMGFMMELYSAASKKKKELKIESKKFIIASKGSKVKDFKKEIPKGDFSIYIKDV